MKIDVEAEKKEIDSYYARAQDLSGKVSDLNRGMAFSTLALIWVFKTGEGQQVLIPQGLMIAAFFAIAALAFDMMHYTVDYVIWRSVARSKERALLKNQKSEYGHPFYYTLPSHAFFFLKFASMLVCYWYVLRFLIERFG